MAKIFEITDDFDERGRGSRRDDMDYMLEKAFKEGCEHGYKKAMREYGMNERNSGQRGYSNYREGFEEKIEKLKERYK